MTSTREIPLDSDALRANIAGTAQDVVIPERYSPLLHAVQDYYGVRGPLWDTLSEYHHNFRNADLLIDGFQTILLRNWSYFERSENRAQLFKLLAELLIKLLEAPLSIYQFSLLLRQLLMWCTTALAGRYGDQYDLGMRQVGEALAALLGQQPIAFLERDTLLRDLLKRALQRPHLASLFAELYRSLLLVGYNRVAERLEIPVWATSKEAELTDPGKIVERFALLAPERVTRLAHGVAHADREELLSDKYPSFSGILEAAIGQIYLVSDLGDRFATCLYFLKDDTLGYRQNEVMGHLLDVVKQMMRPERRMDVEAVLNRLTRFFRLRDNQFLLMRFQCYEAIGVAIGEAANPAAADHLIEDVLYWKFQYPDIRGATDEWETVVNPYHLPKIRCWLHIIESNPALYERLAAALNVQLRLGGVYIADTDLFQRDVTRFLNADIRPIYFVAKQLLRAFPVYFNEVGAEGELRSVTTEIDEICQRRDTLMHFVRKQSHAESSNRLVDFSRAVLLYWATLDSSGLEPYLSANTLAAVRREREWAEGPHSVLGTLRASMDGDESGAGGAPARGAAPQAGARDDGGGPEAAASETDGFLGRLLQLAPADLEARVATLSEASKESGRRVALMVRSYQLLAEKYSLSVENVGTAVGRNLQLDVKTRAKFDHALRDWQTRQTGPSRDRLIDIALQVLEDLKEIILSPVRSTPVENIYQKRHIAAGIPSIYGNYTEPKFDALGLSFRIEKLVSRLLDDLVSEGLDPYITHDSLRRMAFAIKRFERALSADGVDSRNLAANLRLLEASFYSHNFTFHQYQNVFQFLANSVTELSSTSILSHDQVLHTVLEHDPRQCEVRCMSRDAVAEMVLREVLVSALGMQTLDRYVAAALRQISTLTGRLGNQALTRMMNYDPERLVSPIHEAKPSTDEQMTLGFKGLGLKQMASYGYRVPEGFVLTTELFSAMPAMSYRPLYHDTLNRIGRALARLERETGLRLGDPSRPLLLSIRSGAAISMPGLMSTFINVGLNDRLTEALARRPGFEWAAWDSYRRFLQSWAMSVGIERDIFDNIMIDFKSRYGIARKSEFLPEHMREIALAYKRRARELGVRFVPDPFRQLVACVRKVLESWDSPHAKLYRQYVGVADEWGTAVVVQRMVFGNLGSGSGSGVIFTRNPLEPHSRQVRLFGDYTVRSQGEDLVGGLVFPLPISEAQRLGSQTYRGVSHSLEADYPEVYAALLAITRELVTTREYDHQELEFTFESPSAKDLYILQKRAMVQEHAKRAEYFDTSSPAFGPPVAFGMGIAGGAYSGRVAVNAAQIDELLRQAPDENIILLRPDTVPEDIAMITRVNGILTARGGATSHAAVTAKRLGKNAVVDCMALEVVEQQGTARLAGNELHAGNWLSIDGRTGNIFLGRIPTQPEPVISP